MRSAQYTVEKLARLIEQASGYFVPALTKEALDEQAAVLTELRSAVAALRVYVAFNTPRLQSIEVDADLANLLRRFASREDCGTSAVLQDALVLFAKSRGWEPVFDFNTSRPFEASTELDPDPAFCAPRFGPPRVSRVRALAARGLRSLLRRVERS